MIPASEMRATPAPAQTGVRLLAPFDPIVRDRDRFEHLWGWAYRFEAYTPAAKRVRGYYALPLLWKTEVIGWANAKVVDERLTVELGFVTAPAPRSQFNAALKREVAALSRFLRLSKAPRISEI